MREVRHEKTVTVWFHFSEVPGIDKFIESRTVVIQGWGVVVQWVQGFSLEGWNNSGDGGDGVVQQCEHTQCHLTTLKMFKISRIMRLPWYQSKAKQNKKKHSQLNTF